MRYLNIIKNLFIIKYLHLILHRTHVIITTVSIPDAKALRKTVPEMETDYDIIIIDGTPRLDELASTIMLLSDLVISPIKPSAFDLWATEKFIDKYEETKILKHIDAYLLVNQFNVRTNLSQEIIVVLKQFDIPMLNSKLGDRIAYAECVTAGLGAFEYKDEKARNEAAELANEILSLIQA